MAVAQASRSHLKLREEKVCLVERTGQVIYCLIMQACDDTRHPLVSTGMRTAFEPAHAPPWIIPKPPPRSRNELLHPSKFPEVLIEQLIDTFTEEGDNVLDPMAGMGSAVIAALRTGRNGYGIDLSKEFVRISREQIGQEAVLPEIAKSPSPIKVTSIRRRPFAPLASVSLEVRGPFLVIGREPKWGSQRGNSRDLPGRLGRTFRASGRPLDGLRLSLSRDLRLYDVGALERGEVAKALQVEPSRLLRSHQWRRSHERT